MTDTMPTNYFSAQIRSINGRDLETLAVFDSDANADAEYQAHKAIADHLDATMPGQWVYAYGDIEARRFKRITRFSCACHCL